MKARRSIAAPPRHVAVLIETSNRHGRDMVAGVHAYAREHAGWTIHMTERGRNEGFGRRLPQTPLDGIMLRMECHEATSLVRRLGVPAVTLGSVGNVGERIGVAPDCQAMMRLAAEHLTERKLTHFAFFGDDWFEWSVNRGRSFAEEIQRRGFDCAALQCRLHNAGEWGTTFLKIARWLLDLPKPVGITACDDMRARQLLDVCGSLGLSVPEEVSVLGVDNDELFCEMCHPTLSSIVLDGQQIGYEAASLLDDLMDGHDIPLGLRRIAPVGVVARQSTEGFAVDDATVAAAMAFIREHAAERLSVDDVVRAAKTSRRTLERRCRQLLDTTIADQISKIRIRLVQSLLISTDLPLKAIALKTGFEHPEYLSVAFKRSTGQNPSDYRKVRGDL